MMQYGSQHGSNVRFKGPFKLTESATEGVKDHRKTNKLWWKFSLCFYRPQTKFGAGFM